MNLIKCVKLIFNLVKCHLIENKEVESLPHQFNIISMQSCHITEGNCLDQIVGGWGWRKSV